MKITYSYYMMKLLQQEENIVLWNVIVVVVVVIVVLFKFAGKTNAKRLHQIFGSRNIPLTSSLVLNIHNSYVKNKPC